MSGLKNELLAEITFNAADADPWATELIGGAVHDPCVRKIGSQIKEDLPLPAGHERLANQLVDAIESELAAASEIAFSSARPEGRRESSLPGPWKAAGGKRDPATVQPLRVLFESACSPSGARC